MGEKIAIGRANCERPKIFPARLSGEVAQMEFRRKRYFGLNEQEENPDVFTHNGEKFLSLC